MKLMVWGGGREDSVCMANKMGLRPQMLRGSMSSMNKERGGGRKVAGKEGGERSRQLTCCQWP